MTLRLWLAMAVGASCVAAGLGFAAARASGAVGSAAFTFSVVALVGLADYVRNRNRKTGRPSRDRVLPVSKSFLSFAAVGSAVTVASGIVWLVSNHAAGGGVLIAAGVCLLLAPLVLARHVQRTRRRY